MTDQKQAARFTHTAAVGGNGGGHFEIEVPGQLVKRMEIASEKDRLRGIQLSLTDGSIRTVGTMSGSSRKMFEFELGEKIDQLKLWKSGYRDGRSGGFWFQTNKGRAFSVGPQAGSASQLSGGYLGGLFGRCGSDIDQLGFSYANDVSDYYLKDVKYDTAGADASGVVPKNLDTGVLINSSRDKPQKMTYSKTVSITQAKSWSSQFSVKAGVKVGGEAGVPFVASGKVEVSAEVGFSYTWGGSETWSSSQTIQAGPIDVEPGKMYRVVARAESGNLTIPYTGTAILTYEDGTTIQQPESGLFKGLTVGVIQVQITGPFDADPKLRALGPGQHEVALEAARHAHNPVQTVLII